MNLDELTIGQVKQLVALFGNTVAAPQPSSQDELLAGMIGKYVIVRSRNEGINAGEVVAADGTGVILKDARRIWYHRPADTSMAWYEGVAVSGLCEGSVVSTTVPQKAVIEDYSITVCSEVGEASIREWEDHGQVG